MAKKITWSLIEVKASEIRPNPNNPKYRDDKGFSRLQKSLKKFGTVFDGIINKDYTLIDGHSRLELSDTDSILRVFIPSRKLSEQEYSEMNAIFDLAKAGEIDHSILEENFGEEFFDEWDIEKKETPMVSEDDYEIPDEIGTDIVLGDIFEIGPHRLLCGDSTQTDTFKALFGEQMADLVVTDPPYNVGYKGGTKEGLKMKNDNMSDGDFYQFLYDFYTALGAYTKAGGAWYVWFADVEIVNFSKSFVDSGLKLAQMVIWQKNSLVMGRKDYHFIHEPCLYGWKEGAAHGWYSDRKQTTIIKMDRPSRNAEHPTMKPVALFAYQIGNSSKQGDIVADGFGGSGTTMVACHQLGRKAYVVEFDPKYCQVIIDRMRALDPGIVIKKNGLPMI